MTDAAKDALIGWFLRELRRATAITCEDGQTRYPSRIIEAGAAANALVPDVEVLAEMAQEHPDIMMKDLR